MNETLQKARDVEALNETLRSIENMRTQLYQIDEDNLSPSTVKRIKRLIDLADEQWRITYNAQKRCNR